MLVKRANETEKAHHRKMPRQKGDNSVILIGTGVAQIRLMLSRNIVPQQLHVDMLPCLTLTLCPPSAASHVLLSVPCCSAPIWAMRNFTAPTESSSHVRDT